MLPILMTCLSYLLGSLSSAIIFCKLLRLPDPRDQGSGNPGATNVLRFGGKKIAIIVLLGDILKGLIPVLIAKNLGLNEETIATVGLAAFIGHLYPIFFKFKGGKGVATALGVILGLDYLYGFLLVIIWLICAFLFKRSSLSALIAAASSPFFIYFLDGSASSVSMTVLMSLLLFYRHRKNISNLLAGTEPKIGK